MNKNAITEADLEINREFARKLEEHIAARPGLTAAALSVQAGLDNSAVRGILSGRTTIPKLSTMVKLATALGLTLEEFLAGPRTPAELRILRLVSRLPENERLLLLGYAEGLDASKGLPRREDSSKTAQLHRHS